MANIIDSTFETGDSTEYDLAKEEDFRGIYAYLDS
jgi:hypothetical protein